MKPTAERQQGASFDLHSGHSRVPDNHPCDLVSQCLFLTSPFRSMLLTVRGGPQCLAPRAHGAPACPKVLRHSYRELSRRTVS